MAFLPKPAGQQVVPDYVVIGKSGGGVNVERYDNSRPDHRWCKVWKHDTVVYSHMLSEYSKKMLCPALGDRPQYEVIGGKFGLVVSKDFRSREKHLIDQGWYCQGILIEKACFVYAMRTAAGVPAPMRISLQQDGSAYVWFTRAYGNDRFEEFVNIASMLNG